MYVPSCEEAAFPPLWYLDTLDQRLFYARWTHPPAVEPPPAVATTALAENATRTPSLQQ